MKEDYYDTELVTCDVKKRGGVQPSFWFRCYYEFDPGEAEVTRYPDGSGYPGSSPDVNIYKVTLCHGVYESECALHLFEEIYPRFHLEDLEEQILKSKE